MSAGFWLGLVAVAWSPYCLAGFGPVQGSPDEHRLFDHLLQGYEPAIRPIRNASNRIVVKLGLTLTKILDIDENNEVMTTHVWMDQEWKDELLQWNPEDYGGIQSIRMPCDKIWLPDIVLYNNADDYTTGHMRSGVMLYYDGTVFWPPAAQLRSTCRIDATYFPFDSQRCFLKFGSWTYHGFHMDITNRSSNMDLTNYVINSEFELVQVHQKRRVVKYTCCPEPYADVTFFIHVRRRALHYVYSVLIPCVMLSAVTLLVFCLPPDSGEKIALGITVLLAFSVFVLAKADQIPRSSDSVPLIGIYLTAMMAMTFVSVAMSVIVLSCHHRGQFHNKVPRWLRFIIFDILGLILCIKRPNMHTKLSDKGKVSRRPQVALPLGSLKGGTMDGAGVGCKIVTAPATQPLYPSIGTTAEYLIPYHTNCDAGRPISSSPNEPNSEPVQRRFRDSANHGEAPVPAGDHPLRYPGEQEILKTLQEIAARQELHDECEEISMEWRQVAQVIDRLIFWIFLIATVIITLTFLIIIPLRRYSMETEDLEEPPLFGSN